MGDSVYRPIVPIEQGVFAMSKRQESYRQFRLWRAEAREHERIRLEEIAEAETDFYRSYDLLQIMVEVEAGRRIFVDRF